MNNLHDFSFQIFFALLSSIIVPMLLGSLQLLMKGPQILTDHFQKSGLLKKVGIILVLPFYPIYFKIQELMLTELSQDYTVSVSLLEEAKFYSAQFFQIDVGLESHLQLIISTTLLLLANSQTKTITGLEVLFEKETFFNLNTKIVLGLSIAWSLFSCIKSQINGISKKRHHSTTLASVLLIVFTSTSIALRVFSCILYLTPAFGLFNSLRHLQGEGYPFWDPYFHPEHINNVTQAKFYFGDAPPKLQTVQEHLSPFGRGITWAWVGILSSLGVFSERGRFEVFFEVSWIHLS